MRGRSFFLRLKKGVGRERPGQKEGKTNVSVTRNTVVKILGESSKKFAQKSAISMEKFLVEPGVCIMCEMLFFFGGGRHSHLIWFF